MKRLLLVSMILMAAAAGVSATPLPCAGNTNLAALIATNAAGGCTSQGVIFSNFSYTGGGSKTSALVLATLVTDNTFGQNGDGWSFGPSGGWTTGYTLGFTVTVTSNPYLGVIDLVQTVDQIFAGATGVNNHVAASDVESGGVLPNPLHMIATTAGGETAQSNMYSLQTITSLSTITVPSGRTLSNYEQVFYSTYVPEPVTFLLIGSGLIGLAFLRRRSQKS